VFIFSGILGCAQDHNAPLPLGTAFLYSCTEKAHWNSGTTRVGKKAGAFVEADKEGQLLVSMVESGFGRKKKQGGSRKPPVGEGGRGGGNYINDME